MRLAPLFLLAAAACASEERLPEPEFANAIRVEALADGTLRVEGESSSWESLGSAVHAALGRRARAADERASAFVRVDAECPRDTTSRLLVALHAAGVREIRLGEAPR